MTAFDTVALEPETEERYGFLRVYRSKNVLDAAKERIAWLMEEFPNVVVNVSGGKDSTVLFNLAMEVAKDLGKLPLTVRWLDQEAEWQATVDTVKEQMYADGVNPRWFQMPFRMSNSTSWREQWLYAWNPEDRDRWVHPQDPIAITENTYGVDRFHRLLDAITLADYRGKRVCVLTGMRAEESPQRAVSLQQSPTYKWATWGKRLNGEEQVVMHPLYDWHYADVWKAIHEHGWPYNPIYDLQYRVGTPVGNMRVSNVHHEMSLNALWLLQEFEPETWNRLTARLGGIDAITKFGQDEFFVGKLPFMFATWAEYRDYLLQHLVPEDRQEKMARLFEQNDRYFVDHPGVLIRGHRTAVTCILANDYECLKLEQWRRGKPMNRITAAYTRHHAKPKED